jgi:Neuraminidase (sialidase)
VAQGRARHGRGSPDNGKTWGKPVVATDTDRDDRDPSVACLKDGTPLLNWFTPQKDQVAVLLARSTDHGKTWGEPVKLGLGSPYSFACSAPVRQLPDGSLILGLYREDDKTRRAFGATAKSDDGGKTWGPVRPFGFQGHCPYFLRHSSGVILLAHRVPTTSLHWTADEGKTWHGPVRIDTVGGAYPSLVELPDGLVYCVYYEEGKGSSVPGLRLRVDKEGVKVEGRKD